MRRTGVWLGVGLLIAATSGARAAEPIVIGEINPRTGVFGVLGTAVHEGILLAIERANAEGGSPVVRSV
ncbi:MAG: ABC transporter substrate-binding protein [Candidatus Methylomirabilia bacterium]